jgi:predicted dehydrogenase
MFGHMFENSPPMIKIKEIIDEKELGKIYHINASRVYLGFTKKM